MALASFTKNAALLERWIGILLRAGNECIESLNHRLIESSLLLKHDPLNPIALNPQ